MSDNTWKGIIIRSIPTTAKWLPVIPSLYPLSSSADVLSILLAHGMILGRDTPATTSTTSSNTALAARTTEGCMNPNCKAKKRSTHTTGNCYWPGGGKEGQFPPNFGQRSKANAATSSPTSQTTTTSSSSTPAPTSTTTSNQTQHYVLSAQNPGSDGQSGVLIEAVPSDDPIVLISQGFQGFEKGKIPTFMDSGASDTMFVSKDAFVEYKPIVARVGDSAKAVDGGFEIIGEGNVIQRYQVDGKT